MKLSAHVSGTGPLAYPTQDPDTRYPIYLVEAKWTGDGTPWDGGPCKWWPFDPGEGRAWNMMSAYKMFREDPGQEEVLRWATEEWWPTNRDADRRMGGPKIADKNPADVTITATLAYHESWVCTWFQHETFDVGQTDAEALASFQRYVDRHAFYRDWPHNDRTDEELKRRGIEYRVCLMGAGDRWRWTGSGDDGSPDTNTDPPCRCKHCKAAGLIRIGH